MRRLFEWLPESSSQTEKRDAAAPLLCCWNPGRCAASLSPPVQLPKKTFAHLCYLAPKVFLEQRTTIIMTRSSHSKLLCCLGAAAGLTVAIGAQAQTSTQTLHLREGWNAVHLRVAPSADIAGIFAGTPVEVVTSWYPGKQKVSSLQDLSAEPWKSPEWRTWQASGRPGAFLNNLHALESGRAYLIKARRAAEVPVTGAVALDRLQWQSQSFNLTGLPADPESPATLAGFFAGSPAHQPLRVFKLNAGKWQSVSGTATIEPDAAYWIWCGEGSEFQGPLDLRLPENPVLADAASSFTVGLLSASATPLPVRVTATGSLPLTGITRERLAGAAPAVLATAPLTFSANPVEPGQYRIAWAVGAAPATGAASVLEFRSAGVRLSVPVRSAAVTAP